MQYTPWQHGLRAMQTPTDSSQRFSAAISSKVGSPWDERAPELAALITLGAACRVLRTFNARGEAKLTLWLPPASEDIIRSLCV